MRVATHSACHPRRTLRASRAMRGKGTQVFPLTQAMKLERSIFSDVPGMLMRLGPLPLAMLAHRSAGDDKFGLVR